MKKEHLVPLFLVAAVAALATSCGGTRETEVVRTQRTVVQQPIPEPRMTDISIYGLHEQPASAGSVNVVGTIVNHGDRPVSQLRIRVDSLDQTGRLVRSIDTPPLAQTIDPNGGTATFQATVPDDPSVTTYHAVAIAR
ncbi:MAG: FxLYD domain-containing protein [Thermodesulfobacteriota bacterium]